MIHHTGNAHLAQVTAKRETLEPALRERYHVHGYLHEEMGAALAAADLIVGRASSSSIAEPLAFGVPLILVPFAAAAEAHQMANAQASRSAALPSSSREPLDRSSRAQVTVLLTTGPPRAHGKARAPRSARTLRR